MAATTSRARPHAAHRHWLGGVRRAVRRAQDIDELIAQPVFERDALALHPARDRTTSPLVLDVDALDRGRSPGKSNTSLGRTGRSCRSRPCRLPHHRWVQALFDRGPDREGRGEVINATTQVGAVAHADLLDAREQLGRVARTRRTGRARPRSRRREQPWPAPTPAAKWLASSIVPGNLVGARYAVRRASSPCPGMWSSRRTRRQGIGSSKRGSQAFRTASGLTRPISSTRSVRLDASTRSAAKRSAGFAEAGDHRSCRRGETSARTARSNAPRRWAIAPNAAPTPPAPTTRTFIGSV